MIKNFFLRVKRNAPDYIVSLVDSVHGGGFIRRGKHPYSSNGKNDIFFIVGCGRSGNTLLKNILSRDFDVCIPPEIPGLGNTIRQFSRSRHKEWDEVVDDVINEFKNNADVDRFFERGVYNLDTVLGIDYEKVTKGLLSELPNQYGLDNILLSLYSDYAFSNGFGRGASLGDKTPWNAFHLGRIAMTFPNARFVHMVRDPRACVASYIYNFNGVTELNAREASHRWVDSVKKVEKFKGKCSSRVYELKYEDLIKDPVRLTSEVAGFLKLKKRSDCNHCIANTSLGEEVLPHFSKSFTPPDSGSLNKWKSLLTEEEIQVVESICHKRMGRYGYQHAQ